MKIAPGVRLNLTKKGVSARLGPRGVGAMVGTSGTTVSAGVPGTGLHVSEKIKKSAKPNEATSAPSEDVASFGFWGWLGVAGLFAALIWGAFALTG